MSGRVLIVDDLLPNVKLLAAKLTSEYFDVTTACSGIEALQKVKTDKPDIILLDIMMPEMDGFEVCRRLKADPETVHIPVVMVTALSDVADRVKGLETGADDFLTKPVNDVALFARVRSLVRLKMTIDQWLLRENTSGRLGGIDAPSSAHEESYERGRVLVLEDSATDCQKISEALEQDKDSLIMVENIQEALIRSTEEEFDLIIVSVSLMKEDGLRLCSQLRAHENTRQTPILLIASEEDQDRTVKGLEIGANDYIVRPVDRNELLARTRSQIRRKRYQDRLKENYETNISMALTDSLTGLYNRRYLMAHLERLMEEMKETEKGFAFLMFDIDHFKNVNDTYGHDVGDIVLKDIAGRINYNMRNFDLASRIGGEEFVAVFPDTDIETASVVANRLRQVIGDTPVKISDGRSITITTSIGITIANDAEEPIDKIMKRSDNALYKAKESGRNIVFVEIVENGEVKVWPVKSSKRVRPAEFMDEDPEDFLEGETE